MNKLFNKIAALSVGLAMAIGIGVAIGSGVKNVLNVEAAKITDYTSITPGDYYIGATTGGTDYYLSVDGSNLSASIAGTAVTSEASATVFTFAGSGTSWSIQFSSGYYLGLKSSKDNGKVQVVEDAVNFTASNQSSKIRLTIGSYSIQKNNSGTQFGSYGNTQTDLWLLEVESPKTLESLDFTGSLTKTTYYVGDNWDYSGLSVTATFDDDSTEVLGTVNALIASEDLDVTASPATATSTSVTQFTLSGDCVFGDNVESVTGRTFTGITVQPARTMTSIALHGTIDKDEYFLNDNWDLTGLDIQINWSSGDPTYIDLDDETVVYECSPSTANSTSLTSFDIEVMYESFDETFTVSGITVTELPDVLNRALTGVSGTSYTAWSGKTSNSDAVYAGQSAGSYDSIQLRSQSPSGIWTTTSGGIFSGISVTWNSNTAEGRYITIYGKNAAYESADLYDASKRGTPIGTISKGSSTLPSETDLGSYSHIGILASGALYLEEIDINWTQGSLTPSASLDVNEVDLLISVVGSATAHVTINNCEDAEIEWSENSALIELSGADTETVTITPTDDAEVANVSVSLYVLGTDLEYSATLTVHILEPEPGESPETAYSVADILALSTLPTENVYGTGYITTITEVSTTHGNATYNISDDKSATNQMVVYRGRYLNNAAFTSSDEIKINDEVIVYGQLGTYNNLNQFAAGNYLYSLERETPTECTVTYDANGGTGTMTDSDSPYTYEDTVTVLTNTFTRVGYTFDHWNTKADDTGYTYANGATFTITDNVTLYAQWTAEIPSDFTGNYKLATNQSDLADGKYVIITSGKEDSVSVMSTTQASNNRGITSATVSSDLININSSTTEIQVFTLEAAESTTTEESGFGFKAVNGVTANKYIYAASSGSNYLRSESELSDNGIFKTTVASSGISTMIAQGSNTHNQLKYNGGSSCFSCYTGGQSDVYIFVQVSDDDVTISLDKSSATINLATETHAVQITATVGPASLVDKSVTWTSSTPAVASVDSTGLVTGLTTGKTTITATTTVDSKSASCEITVVETKSFTKISSTNQLWPGQELLIAQSTDAETLKVAKHYVSDNNNLKTTVVEQTNGVISTDDLDVTFILGQVVYDSNSDGVLDSVAWTLFDGTYYLYAASTSDNHLKGKTTLDSSCYWNISISDGVVTVESVTNSDKPYMRYNGSSSCFSCYGGGQADITFYVKDTNSDGTSAAKGFADTFMHMDASVEGQCNTYYPDAKVAWTALNADVKAKVISSQASAYARLQAWAAAHGEVINGNLEIVASGRIAFLSNMDITKNNGAALIIVIVSVLSVTAVGGYFLLEKKKTK